MTSVQTFQLATAIMFLVYFVTALVGVRLFGGLRAAIWFAASNALRALSLLLAFSLRPDDARAAALPPLLTIAGLVLLHRSFAEQLDRPKLLWRL